MGSISARTDAMLRISRLTDYGIVLLARFAAGPPGARRSARDLAADTGIPLPTVSKLLKALTRSGLLASTRGTQGGYRLAREPADVSVADVIGALEGPIALTTCATEAECGCEISPGCPVRTNWQRITDAVRTALEAVPLAEMTLPDPSPTAPLPAAAARAPSPGRQG